MVKETTSSHHLQLAAVLLEKEGFTEATLLQAYQLLLVHGARTEAQIIITQGGTFWSHVFSLEFMVQVMSFSKDDCHTISSSHAFL